MDQAPNLRYLGIEDARSGTSSPQRYGDTRRGTANTQNTHNKVRGPADLMVPRCASGRDTVAPPTRLHGALSDDSGTMACKQLREEAGRRAKSGWTGGHRMATWSERVSAPGEGGGVSAT